MYSFPGAAARPIFRRFTRKSRLFLGSSGSILGNAILQHPRDSRRFPTQETGIMATNGKLNRKLRMALVGGGQGAFIGRVHATAAILDNRAMLVAGALWSDP